MLGALDRLDPPARRILLGAPAGTGKSTLARRIHARTGVPYRELDSLFHGPGWTELPAFRDDVEAFSSQDAWVSEWQYTTQLGQLLPSRADTLVWLDLPATVQMRRLIRRTLHRRWYRTELWHGNVEPPLATILTNPEHIVRWGWKGRAKLRARIVRAAIEHPHLRIVRLRSTREVDLWLRGLPRQDQPTRPASSG
ncbi:AAA family ATPase [Clavibacter zhangzhiyongii]|uniref:AAA family ATPase n=1 Tax=Clavibacter zhangzhiyongii TaxID=2768071 RepID=UPI0039E00B93